MRGPVTYFGGKADLAERILALMPPHRVYLEPFFGGGSVFFAKQPATHEIINDRDDAVVAFFRCLRDRPDELERACRLTPYSRTEFYDADLNAPGLDDLELARRWWVRVNQAFSKTAGDRTGWSRTTARTQSPPRSALSRLARFEAVAARLAGVTIDNTDAADLIDTMATPDSVIYCDPPYVHSTRRVSRQATASDYRCEMSDEDHRRLAKTLEACPGTVLLSGYHGALYDELYAGWWRTEWTVVAHSSNSRSVQRSGRVEVLWSNRELDTGRLFA